MLSREERRGEGENKEGGSEMVGVREWEREREGEN